MGKTPEKPHATTTRTGTAHALRYRRKSSPAVPSVSNDVGATLDAAVAPIAHIAPIAPVSAKHKQPHKQPRRLRNNSNSSNNQDSGDADVDVDMGDNQREHHQRRPSAAAAAALTTSTSAVTSSSDCPFAAPSDAHASMTRRKKQKPSATPPTTTTNEQPPTTAERTRPVRNSSPRSSSNSNNNNNSKKLKLKLKLHKDAAATSTDHVRPASPIETTTTSTQTTSTKHKQRNVVIATEENAAVVVLSAPQAATPSAIETRRRKPPSGPRTTPPSLLKQLLWKAKTPAAAVPTPTPALTPTPLLIATASHATNDAQSIASSSSSTDGDDEVAFATAERLKRKQFASSLVAKAHQAPVGIASSSSQETQSGSDDDASFRPLHLLSRPSDSASDFDALVTATPPAPARNSSNCFPSPLALDALIALTNANTPRAQIHDVALVDFALVPSTLSIVQGDVVVFRVSSDALTCVEHAFDATLFDVAGAVVSTTTTPLLDAGSAVAWRLDTAGRVDVTCATYNAQCTITIHDSVAAKRESIARAAAPPQAQRNKKKKKKNAGKTTMRRAAAASTLPLPVAGVASTIASSPLLSPDSNAPLAVFHPTHDLALAPELDAGVCRAVLAQLADVHAAIASSFIVVGDIACPVVDTSDTSDSVGESDDASTAAPGGTIDDVDDFQQRIVAMLERSEAAQLEQRSSFCVVGSGFDAEAAYDFFKHRFAHVQRSDASVAYARCRERRVRRRSAQMLTRLVRTLAV